MRTPHLVMSLLPIVLATLSSSCGEPRSRAASTRWVKPAETAPHGRAPGAKHRLVAAHADGTKEFALVLYDGDEALTGLADFARDEHVVNAHFVAIGAVRDPEVGWFDVSRQEYKAMTREEQMEVLTLSGDIALAETGAPVVHAHLVLGGTDGSAWGGHLLRATVSPTLEVYITTYPQALYKQLQPESGLQLIDPSLVH